MNRFLLILLLMLSTVISAKSDLLDNVQWYKNGWNYNYYGNTNNFRINSKNQLVSFCDEIYEYYNYFDEDSFRFDPGCAGSIMKYNSNGKKMFKKYFRKPDSALNSTSLYSYNLAIDRNDNIITAGCLTDTVIYDGQTVLYGDNKSNTEFITKFDDKGNFLWTRTLYYGNSRYFAGLCTDSSNNIYITGYLYDSLEIDGKVVVGEQNNNHIFIAKLDPDGRCLWLRKVKFFSRWFDKIHGIYADGNQLALISDRNNLYFQIFDYQFINSDDNREFISPYVEGFGIVCIDADDGRLKDVYHIGSTLTSGYVEHPLPIEFNVINGSIYINGEFGSEITIGKTTLVSNETEDHKDNNAFLLKYNTSTKENTWLKLIKSDWGKVYSQFFNSNNLIVRHNDKLFIAYQFNDGTLILDDTVIKGTNASGQSALAVCDTNGLWLEAHFTSGKNWYLTSHDVDKSGGIYLWGFYNDSAHINDRLTIKPKFSNQSGFLLKIGEQCAPESFLFPDFKYHDNINVLPPASVDSSVIILTPVKNNISGAAWTKDRPLVKNGFSTTFSFKMQNGKNSFDDGSLPGGDGLAFVIQNAGIDASGSFGGGIGYAGIPNSVAIEFDSYRDYISSDSINDPNGNHIAVFSNGAGDNSPDHKSAACLATKDDIITLRADGTVYYSKIEYDASDKKLYVYVDSTDFFRTPPLVLDNFDLTKILDIKDGRAFIGFTSATGSAVETHEILDWDFCQASGEIPNSVDNDSHVEDKEQGIRSYPNPFANTATIEFNIEAPGFADVRLCDVFGNEIQKVFNGFLEPGSHRFEVIPGSMSSGVYVVRLRIGNEIKAVKLEYMK